MFAPFPISLRDSALMDAPETGQRTDGSIRGNFVPEKTATAELSGETTRRDLLAMLLAVTA